MKIEELKLMAETLTPEDIIEMMPSLKPTSRGPTVEDITRAVNLAYQVGQFQARYEHNKKVEKILGSLYKWKEEDENIS